MAGRNSSGPTAGQQMVQLPHHQHGALNLLKTGSRESSVRTLARDIRPGGKQAPDAGKWLENMDIWYFDTKGIRKARWFWIRVARNGTLVAKSSQFFEYYLHVLDDARAHGFDGKPRLGSPSAPLRKPRRQPQTKKAARGAR